MTSKRAVRKDFSEKAMVGQRPEEKKEQVLQVSRGRTFQIEEQARAKSLRQKYTYGWKTARMSVFFVFVLV